MTTEKVYQHDFGQLLTPKEVAKMIRRSESSLARDRYKGIGIPYIKYNRFVYYRLEDVRLYVSQHLVASNARQFQAEAVN